MSTVEAVTRTLLLFGERPATGEAGGFQVQELKGGIVAVRWRPPDRTRGSDAGLAFLEEYACLLRAAGIYALVTTEAGDPRVLCSPVSPSRLRAECQLGTVATRQRVAARFSRAAPYPATGGCPARPCGR